MPWAGLFKSEPLCLEGQMEVAGKACSLALQLATTQETGGGKYRCSGAQGKLKMPLSWVRLRVTRLEGGT